eukprot:5859113-Lingulodinium_polyedra.AAC.1
MMCPTRRFVAAAARAPRVCAFHAQTDNRSARGVCECDLRAVAAAKRRFERIVVQRLTDVAQ